MNNFSMFTLISILLISCSSISSTTEKMFFGTAEEISSIDGLRTLKLSCDSRKYIDNESGWNKMCVNKREHFCSGQNRVTSANLTGKARRTSIDGYGRANGWYEVAVYDLTFTCSK